MNFKTEKSLRHFERFEFARNFAAAPTPSSVSTTATANSIASPRRVAIFENYDSGAHLLNPRNPDKAADGALMSDLIRELVFTYFRLRAAGDELAIRYGQSTGKWGMMRSLREGGPQSVSQIARSRPVARQGVQRMANELAREGLIEFVDNPTHRSAKLMKLTSKGEKILTGLYQSELRWTGGFARRFSRSDIEKAMEVVRALKNTLSRA